MNARSVANDSTPKRVGLLVVHGIGEQKRGKTLESVVEGLEVAYGPGSFPLKDNVAVGKVDGHEVRISEVYWKPVLSGERVRGSFQITQPQQLVWYPLLNWLNVQNFSREYPRRLVFGWTAALIPLGAAVTASHIGLSLVASFLEALVNKPRESAPVAKLASKVDDSKFMGRVLSSVRKSAETGQRRNWLDRYLDGHFADIFNYVNAAGKANAHVPEAAREIYKKFEATLTDAVEHGCSEIQILAHSLGTVITYHALTTYRSETEQLVSLDPDSPNRPRLTRLYTIGSPLEKFRFFWPKLTEQGETEVPAFRWDNFASPGDPIAGVLKRYDAAGGVHNHTVNGAGGLISAHKGYRRHPSFLRVFGPALTGQPIDLPGNWSERSGNVLRGIGETVGVPLLLLASGAAGVLYLYYLGKFVGWLFGKGIWLLTEGARRLIEADWKWHEQVSGSLPEIVGWLMPIVLVVVAPLLGYSSGKRLHEDHWREGVALRRRRKVPDKSNSPYRTWKSYIPLAGQIAILAGIGWVGYAAGPSERFSRPQAWFIILALMTAFAAVAGRGITGYWRGILIDSRNRMSLSRLQLLTWTLVILSAILTAVLTNTTMESAYPLAIRIPPELWVLLGITTASAVASPAVLSTKKDKKPDAYQFDKTVDRLRVDEKVNVDERLSGVILSNQTMADARWGDLLKGDESGNAANVDLGKIQMFFFTFVLALGYGAAITRLFDEPGFITALPTIDSSMNTLLGISHTGYLANKTVSYSREEEPPKTEPTK